MLQRPGVRGRLRECPICGARQVRWQVVGDGPREALWCRCGARALLPQAPRDQTVEAVETARLRMTRP